MELRHLKTFRTVAALNSFNQAANVLHYAQSTVSEQIKSLEQNLNVQLFNRAGKSIILTEAGERLLEYTQRILDIEDELKSEITNKGKHYGSLSFRIPETVSIFYLPKVLKQFHFQFPNIKCNFNDCTYFSLRQEFQSGITDLAFLITDDEIKTENLEVEILAEIPLVLITHPDNKLNTKNKVTVQDFNDQTIILPKNDCRYRRMFERILFDENVKPRVIFNFNNLEAIKKSVIAGIGIALVSEISIRDELRKGILSILPWNGKKLISNLLMIRLKDKWLSPTLQAFMEITRETMNRS